MLRPSKQSLSRLVNPFWKGLPYVVLERKHQIHDSHFIATTNGIFIHLFHQNWQGNL
jgi:hypothetical protein